MGTERKTEGSQMNEAVLTRFGGGDEWDWMLVLVAVMLFRMMVGG